MPPGGMIFGNPGDTTLVGAGYTELLVEQDVWRTATSIIGAPTRRHFHTAVWTGSRMIVWGGRDASGFSNTGGQYDPVSDS